MNGTLAVFVGAAAGAGAGVVVLVLTDPMASYVDDSVRQNVTMGFVTRYVVLGVAAALLIGALDRYPVPAGFGLAILLAVAILPPALDTSTPSAKRKPQAVADENPSEMATAAMRAGAVDGCVDDRRRGDLKGAAKGARLADAYCACFIKAVVKGPPNDEIQIRALGRQAQAGRLSTRLRSKADRCTAIAAREVGS